MAGNFCAQQNHISSCESRIC